jgi:hypothetical protein
MSLHRKVPTIHFDVGPDKADATTRCDRGAKVAGHAPQSPLYALADVKSAADNTIASAALLKALADQYNAARQAWLKAGSALKDGIVSFDTSYGQLISAAEKHCITPSDGIGLGLEPHVPTLHPLLVPTGITMTFNGKMDYIRIHVHRAKGTRVAATQVTQDPTNPASWKELDGYGAVHLIHNPAPGTWWARAASKKASAISDFTTPVSVTVR